MEEVLELCTGRTYGQAANMLTEQYGEYVSAEQLRSAIRRYKGREDQEEAKNRFVEATPAVPKRRTKRETYQRASVVQEVIFGALGDSHLCSNYERNDILESLYDEYEARGVTTVYHTGNYIDGEAPFNTHEIHVHGIDGQCAYFLQNYPQRTGIRTLVLDGDDHEGWTRQKHGMVVGQHLEDMARRSGRDDIYYLGYMEADVQLVSNSDRTIRVLHPGGGSSYALSHTSQKIVDSYEEYERPDILIVGHYHKAHFLPNYRGVSIIQTGTTQEPTPFMRKKRLHADLGGWIITVGLSADDEIVKLQAEFIHYPARTWKHR